MKIHLIDKRAILEYTVKNAGSRSSFDSWPGKLKQTDWEEPGDIRKYFNSADFLGNGSQRVVFNIGGNNYRMICKYQFGQNYVHLFICWIGTHREYDSLNKNGLQFTIWNY